MRKSAFILILALTFVINIHGNEDNEQEEFYPPDWHLAPSSLSDFPSVNGLSSQYRLIDPWLYHHRLGLYKILITLTTPLMPFCSSSNASNILFALPSQFGWLFRSNRLFTNGTMHISTYSWWGSANYYLAVIPFLVATNIGLIKSEPFQIVQYENFCSNFSECLDQIPDAITQWNRLFFHLQHPTLCIKNKQIDNEIIDKCYLTYTWSAYKSTIDNALPLVKSKLNNFSSNIEKIFGQSWAKLINLISMTKKNTNLYQTIKNQRKFLPLRMLQESDRKADSKDLPDTVNKSLKVLLSFRFNWLSFIEKIWTRLTCNYEARVYAQYTLDTVGESKLVALKYLAQTTVNAFLHKCDLPS